MSRPDAVITWQQAWLKPLPFRESPTNLTPFAEMIGVEDGHPWCCTWRVASHRSTSTPIPPGGGTWSSITNHAAYRRAGLMVDPGDIAPGDIFWLAEDGVVVHEGTVRARVGGTRFSTLEGNWRDAVASLVRDYAVAGRTRIAGFARPRWDGHAVAITNLPTDRDTTTSVHFAVPAVYVPKTPPGHIAEDGQLGSATWASLQRALGVTADGVPGARTISALQRKLNTAVRAGLRVDGDLGAATIRALQAYLGTPRDGVLSRPVSTAVLVLQQRLNAGSF